jgi:DnaJ-class molecular chaperone
MDMLQWRSVEVPCQKCHGSGVSRYGSTSTWQGGAGGAEMTTDVCDQCWGTGDERRTGADLRELTATRSEWEDEQCLKYFANRTGATLGITRRHMSAIAEILGRETRRRTTPFDAGGGRIWWFQTLEMVAAALREFATLDKPKGTP